MNALTTASKPTKLDDFRMQILPPEKRHEMVVGMPKHVNADRFERNLVNALMQNADLMQCDPRLIFREISKAAALGLYLDPQLGEAYLIVGWNGKRKAKEPQLRIGYRGLIKLGRQSGEISQIYAHEVHANDAFKASLGDEKKLLHEPDIFGDRGPIVGYYAVVKYKDGDTDFEPLTIAQAHAIRDRSDGWKAFQAGKIKSTPWSTDEVEMSKKTAIRRLTKRIPQSPELAEALRIEDAAEHSDGSIVATLTPPRPPAPPAPPRHEIDYTAHNNSVEDAEVIDGAVEAGGDDQGDGGAEVDDSGTGEVSEDQAPEDETVGDYFERMERDMAAADNVEDIVEVWNDMDPLAKFEGDEESQSLATSIKRKHVERVGQKRG